MKPLKIIYWVFLFTLGIFLLLKIIPSAAAEPKTILDGVSETFQKGLQDSGLSNKLVTYAKYLFYSLATIQLAWNLGQLFMEGRFEAQAIVALMVRQILILGFFYTILTNGVYYFNLIIGSFFETGKQLAKVENITSFFSTGTKLALELYTYAWRATPWSEIVPVMLTVGIASLIILIAFSTATLAAVGTLCETYIAASIGVYFLGFGACDQTRDIAINALKATYASGVRIFTILILIGLGNEIFPLFVQSIPAAGTPAVEGITPTSVAFQLVIASFVFAGCVKSLPGYVSGIVTGAITGSTSNLAGAVAGAAGAAVGAAMTVGATAVGGVAGAVGAGKGARVAGALKGAMGGATGGIKSIAKQTGRQAIQKAVGGKNPNNVSPF